MFLHAGHGGGAVIENQHDVPGGRRVVDHLDQAGDAAVHEGAVADDADHAARLLGRQHVAHAEPDAERRAHADQRIHGLKRWKHAQRVAADIAGHDAVQVAQRGEHGAVRATGTQLGGLAGGRLRFGRLIARRHAPHAGDVELAKPEGFRRSLDGDARRARRVG